MNFVSFPSIEGFHNAVKYAEVYDTKPVVHYRGKIKLHGTNAGVRVKNGEIAAQSRTQLVTPTEDNAGFARWVEQNKEYFKSLATADHTIFGEWCGPGIMKGTAINQIPNKIFAVFAVQVGADKEAMMMLDPEQIAAFLGNKPSDVHVLPWYGGTFTADYGDRTQLQEVADMLNKHVEDVEPTDPWVKAVFGIEGTGEGVVYYPYSGQLVPRESFSNYAFKAKGEKHKVVKTKEAVQIDPEVAACIEDFVKMFVTEARLEQGLTAVGGAELKSTGAFLKWFCQDVEKESRAELEASSLTWAQVQKDVQVTARTWFVEKCKKI